MTAGDEQAAVSDLRLERYRLGEMPRDERDAIANRLAADSGLRDRLAALERSDAEIGAAYPARVMSAAIRRRARDTSAAERRPGLRHRWLVPVAVATCVCAMAVSASVWLRVPSGDDTRMKGAGTVSLVVHRRVDEGSQELAPGAVVRQGDQVRVGYRASGRRYGAILSVDGRGTLTQHLPRAGDGAAALEGAGTVFLDFAYELDDAPRSETFYFVAADAPFDLEPVRDAIRRTASRNAAGGASLTLPDGFTHHVFPLTKDDRR